MHKCQTLLAKLPVLANASEEVLYNIMAKLQFEVYFPDDIIFQMGQYTENKRHKLNAHEPEHRLADKNRQYPHTISFSRTLRYGSTIRVYYGQSQLFWASLFYIKYFGVYSTVIRR